MTTPDTRTSFTSGPWHVGEEPPRRDIYSDNMEWIATSHRPYMNEEVGHANARLMAAAPELYAALRRIVEQEELLGTNQVIARAALAKADGRG